ncbi:MAG: tetratricopeptide repeat protein [Planctomycetota bacterium]|nr:tetratricopeptide repeat protein [Planctomycetota bacterium]
MDSTGLSKDTKLFDHVLREPSDGHAFVIWLPDQAGVKIQDWLRILAMPPGDQPVGDGFFARAAAIDLVRQLNLSVWSKWFRPRKGECVETLSIPNNSRGEVIGPRRRDALLVWADGEAASREFPHEKWPDCERVEQLGPNLWLVVGTKTQAPGGPTGHAPATATPRPTASAASREPPRFRANLQPATPSPNPYRDRPRADQAAANEPQVIRVFVSSTFLDMKAERDYLEKFTFPKLRQLCEARGVQWGDVELRWGITDEDVKQGRFVPLIMKEIERCQPWFIGLLGERYGSVPTPEQLPHDLIQQYPWINECRDRSVTELEIIRGVFQNENSRNRAFFYFRDPGYVDRLPPEIDRQDFADTSSAAREKLAQLKQRLRESYKAGSCQAAGHAAFARSRTHVYRPRQEDFDRLDAHASSAGPPLVVLGESGIGKSALLANWVQHHREQHPQDFVLAHYVGSTSESTDAVRLMHRLTRELRHHLKLPGDADVAPEQVRVELLRVLSQIPADDRVILVLDGLNQLDDVNHAPDLGWLPSEFPANVRVVVSTLPGRSLDAVRRRHWPETTVGPLAVSERNALIVAYLAEYGRRLSPEIGDRIASAPPCTNPLFLRAVLDELRICGEHDRLGQQVADYLDAKEPQELYVRILQRWEQDYSGGRDLVRRSLSLLWAARRGLSEQELLELLGEDGLSLPQETWEPLYLAAEHSLLARSDLLDFSHDYVRRAVQQHYIETDQDPKRYHRELADFFDRRITLSNRKLDELPWQLQRAEQWESLKNLLADMSVFMRFREDERRKVELQSYWLRLAKIHDPCEVYRRAVTHWENDLWAIDRLPSALSHLGLFHYERAEYDAAEPVFHRALAIDEQSFGPEHSNVAVGLNNLAQLLQATDRLGEAEPLMRRALAIDEQSFGPEHPNVAIGLDNLALLLKATNRLGEAEPLFRRALAITEQSYGAEHPGVAKCLDNLASLFHVTNRLGEAELLHRRALAIFEQSYGAEHPDVATCLNNLASLLKATNRLGEAEPLFRRALAIAEQSYGAEHPGVATCLDNLASLLQATDRLGEAESLMRRALAIFEQSFGGQHPQVATCLVNLAAVLTNEDRLGEAEPLIRRALAIFEQSYGPEHPKVAIPLNDLAWLLSRMSHLREAEPLFRRALAIVERSYGGEHPEVAKCLDNLASLLHVMNRLREAELLHRRALAIFEQSFGVGHPDVATCLLRLAEVLRDNNRLAEAEPLMRRHLEFFLQFTRVTGHPHPHLKAAIGNYAGLLSQMGRSEPEIRTQLKARAEPYGVSFGD